MSITYTPVDVTSGYNLDDINANFVAVQTAFLNALSLDGTTPNAMTADLDLGSNDLLNGGTIRASSFVQNGTALSLVEVGINWLGDWALATNYAIHDGTLNVGTTYRCILGHTSEASITKPGTGSDWETYWAVLALKGTDGAGVGDMTKATYDSNDDGIVDQAAAVPFSGITSTPTSLAGYGIIDAQGLNAYLTDIASITPAQGEVLYFNGTDWVALGVGTLGQFLKSGGAAANPEWAYSIPKRAYAEYTTYSSHTSVIPADDSIPQITEGDEILSVAFAASSATARVRISISVPSYDNYTAASTQTIATFNGATNAIDAYSPISIGNVGLGIHSSHTFEYVPGTDVSKTYSVRIGPTVGTIYVNGSPSSRLYGGVQKCTLIVEEIA